MEWREDEGGTHFEATAAATQKCFMVDNRRVTIFPRYRRKRGSSPMHRQQRHRRLTREKPSSGVETVDSCSRNPTWRTRINSRRVEDDDCATAAMLEDDCVVRKVASAKEKEVDPLLEYEEDEEEEESGSDIARVSQPCLNSDDNRSLSKPQFLPRLQSVAKSTSTHETKLFNAAKQRSLCRDARMCSSQSVVSSSATNRSHECTARFIRNRPHSSGSDGTHVDPFCQTACSQSELLTAEENLNSSGTWNQSTFLTRFMRFFHVTWPSKETDSEAVHSNAGSEVHSSISAGIVRQSESQMDSSSSVVGPAATERTEHEDGGFYQQNLSLGLNRNKLRDSKSEESLNECHSGPSGDCRQQTSASSRTRSHHGHATKDSDLRSNYNDSHHHHEDHGSHRDLNQPHRGLHGPHGPHRSLHHDVAAAYFLGRHRVPQSASQQLLTYAKTFLAFLFSTIGLTFLLVGYTIIGGFLFRALEAPNETQVRSDMNLVRLDYISRLWALTETLNVLHPVNWSEMAESLLVNYTTEVFLATKKLGWDGKDLGETERQWSFAGSLLYSITVITTIGYGHITPKTDWGRVVTMMYAIFGIPLTLLTMAQLGGFMAKTFRCIYKNICCGLCCICCARKKRQKRKFEFTMAHVEDEQIESADDEETTTRSPTNQLLAKWVVRLRRLLDAAFDDVDNVRVPSSVSLLLIVSYIAIGAVMFNAWEEGEWGFLVGCYFCFITLSTIGFGDYVPGTSLDSWAAQEKLIICALYLLFGLALIAMCFNLMQEEARRNIRALGRRLGLIDKDEDIPRSAYISA